MTNLFLKYVVFLLTRNTSVIYNALEQKRKAFSIKAALPEKQRRLFAAHYQNRKRQKKKGRPSRPQPVKKVPERV